MRGRMKRETDDVKKVDEVWTLPGEQMRREKKQRRRNREVGEIG